MTDEVKRGEVVVGLLDKIKIYRFCATLTRSNYTVIQSGLPVEYSIRLRLIASALSTDTK